MPPAPGPGDEAVRALARAVLARPEYASWHVQELGPLLAWLARVLAGNAYMLDLVVAALVIVVLAIVAHLAWTLRKGLATHADAADHPRVAESPRFTAEAEALARGGRFLDASRVMQLGAIDRLARAGLLRLGRGDPNTVLRRRLGESPLGVGVREDLLAAIAELERRWFRDRAEDEDLYRRWQRVHSALDATLAAA